MYHIFFSQGASTSLICIKMFIFYQPQGEGLSATESTLCSTIEFSVWMGGIPNSSREVKFTWTKAAICWLFSWCLLKKNPSHSNWLTADILLQRHGNFRCSPIAPNIFFFLLDKTFDFWLSQISVLHSSLHFCGISHLVAFLSCGLSFGKKMPWFSEVPTLHWKERMQIW